MNGTLIWDVKKSISSNGIVLEVELIKEAWLIVTGKPLHGGPMHAQMRPRPKMNKKEGIKLVSGSIFSVHSRTAIFDAAVCSVAEEQNHEVVRCFIKHIEGH